VARGDTAAEEDDADEAAEEAAGDEAADIEAEEAEGAEGAEEAEETGEEADEVPPDEQPAAAATTAPAATAPPSLSSIEAVPNMTNHPFLMTGMSARARSQERGFRPAHIPMTTFSSRRLARDYVSSWTGK
jgi:hypothetical protein